MEKQFIDECEYKGLLEKVRYGSDSLEEAIDIFEYLKDKRTVETELFRGKVPVEYPHIKFLSYILNSTISDFAAGFSESDEEFLQSEYLQNQLKIEISRMLKNSSQELMELVNSDKNIKDFSKEELKEIIGTLDNIGKSLEGEEKEFYEDFHYIFEDYLFELGGQGPVEYTKEIHGRELPKEMLERSNVRSMPSYYSGYSVDSGLLGERHLFSLYKKFSLTESSMLSSSLMFSIFID